MIKKLYLCILKIFRLIFCKHGTRKKQEMPQVQSLAKYYPPLLLLLHRGAYCISVCVHCVVTALSKFSERENVCYFV